MTTEYRDGFKVLTEDNWLEPDDVATHGVIFTDDGRLEPITGNRWVQRFMTPQLLPSVPDEVQRLFEIARSAMAYGYFFYPLFTLAEDQLYRVVEAAVTIKFLSMRLGSEGVPFKRKIQRLIEEGIILATEEVRWLAVVDLRNAVSHPKDYHLVTPITVLRNLCRITGLINLLFP